MILGTGAVVCGLADWSGKRIHNGHYCGNFPHLYLLTASPVVLEQESSTKARGSGLLIEWLIEK